MYLECNCTNISLTKWNQLMEGAKRMDKRKLHKLVKSNCPNLYKGLSLHLHNPYNYYKTKTHYILVHSGIEYFLRKD
jgi:hypothetical protein